MATPFRTRHSPYGQSCERIFGFSYFEGIAMNTRAFSAAFMLALSLTGCATTRGERLVVADADPSRSDAAWQRMDSDGDGNFSQAEAENQHAVALQDDWWRADANGDGRISRDEWDTWWPYMTRTPEPASMARLNQSSAR